MQPCEYIVLTGVRNMTTFNELNPAPIAKSHHWHHIEPRYDLSPSVSPQLDLMTSKGLIDSENDRCQELNIKVLMDHYFRMTAELSPILWQGYMIVDNKFRRVFVTSPQGHALAKLNLFYRKQWSISTLIFNS